MIGYKPKEEVPLFALNVAWLEKAASCGNKRAVIDKIQSDGDPAAMMRWKLTNNIVFSAGNGLPNGRRAWYVHYRNGSDVVNNTAFVLSVNPGA